MPEINPTRSSPASEINPVDHSVAERFVSHVVVSGGCWIWTAARDSSGYGVVRVAGRQERAHRLSWMVFRGPIPSGACVCHTCDNPQCVNPDHLWVGTHQDNMDDKVRKGRVPRGGQHYMAARLRASTGLNDYATRIKAMRASGLRVSEIARRLGIKRTTVSSIAHRANRTA